MAGELDEIRMRKMKELERRIAAKKYVPSEPIQITDQTFDKTIKKNPLIVIDFWAGWCPPCHIIAPIIEELAKTHAGRVVFGKINVDENKATAVRYGITAIPALLFFKNGKLVDQVLGAVPRQQLEEKIRKFGERSIADLRHG
jgi:thioredoxin 1